MSSPLISVRKLDANHDPIWGHGQADFLTDIYAVAQLIQTRLLLLQGEWWEDLNAGFPLFQQILGTPNASRQPELIALIIQQQILLIPYTVEVTNVQTSYTPAQRKFTYTAEVITAFSQNLIVTFTPGQVGVIFSS